MRCPKCGNDAPLGSAFCNRCGTPLSNEMTCPVCGKMIPANSVFCPKCGKMVRNDMEEETVETASEATTFNEQRRREQAELQRREQQRAKQQEATRQRANAWDQESEANDDDDDDDNQVGSGNFNRNLLIGILAAVVIIGGLLLLRNCGESKSDRLADAKADSTLVAEAASQDPLAIFASELNRNNLMGDGATASAAVLVPGDGAENPDRIWGVTYVSNAIERSFFKVYELTRSGSIWNPEMLHVKYIEKRAITMDNSNMMADIQAVPRAVKVDGKECLFFAYMWPMGVEGSQGGVSLNLFDVKAKKLTSLDYVGTIKSRSDGRQYIFGEALDPINNAERRFLKDETKNIKVLYFPTDEELQAEKEAKEKEEMEKKMSSPDSADARWNQENKEIVEQAKGGDEVKMKKSTYDKPIFHKEDISNQIHSEGYSVFLTKNGSVYGFDKNTRKYFTIYSKGANEIGFRDSKNHLLGIKTSNGGHYQYNLSTGSLKSIN